MTDCQNLSELPDGLEGRGHLALGGTKIKQMPQNYKVGGYYVGNVPSPEKVYWRPQELSFQEVISIQDVEVRRVAIERMGWEIFLHRAEGKFQVINADPDPLVGTLIRIPMPGEDEPCYLLRMRDANLPRHYILRVPPTYKTAREANAWTWNSGPSEYNPKEQS